MYIKVLELRKTFSLRWFIWVKNKAVLIGFDLIGLISDKDRDISIKCRIISSSV